MPTLLCFGDSNTHGVLPMTTRPSDLPRLDARWPRIASKKLGWELIEEGLPGRTFAFPDPEKGPHMDGRLGLFVALESHAPIDALAIMLGTNDCKACFDASPEEVAAHAGFHLDVALSEEMQGLHGGFEPFLIVPPPPFAAGVLADFYDGAAERFAALKPLLMAEAEKRDVACFDAGIAVACSPVDGVHLDESAHLELGQAFADFVASEIEEAG